ncbi:DUF1653 domain-containing protein [Actinosynnema sp. NPDC002837]
MTERVRLGLHEHFSGHRYNVLGFGHYVVGDGVEENVGDEVVVYHATFTSAAYGEQHTWVRPVDNFVEEVEVDGTRVPRFRFVGEEGDTTGQVEQ